MNKELHFMIVDHNMYTWTSRASAVAVAATGAVAGLALALRLLKTSAAMNKNIKSGPSLPLSVAVVGAGAVGIIAGVKLLPYSENDADDRGRAIRKVILIGRKTLREQVQANDGCISVRESFRGGTTTTVHVDGDRLQVLDGTKIDTLQSCLPECQVILVATKTVDTEKVAVDLAKAVPASCSATIVSLQNGLDNAEILKRELTPERFPNLRILTAVVAYPAEWETSSTTVHLNMKNGKIFIEKPQKQDHLHAQRIQILTDQWTSAGLASKSTYRIVALKYIKLLSNLINPLNALAGITVPQQMVDAGHRQLLADTIVEATTVLGRYDVDLKHQPFDCFLFRLVGGWIFPVMLRRLPDSFYQRKFGPAAAIAARDQEGQVEGTTQQGQQLPSGMGWRYKSSTLQDLERRRTQTEMIDLCGPTMKLGEENGVPTPIHSALFHMVEGAAEKQQGSPYWSADEIRRRIKL